MAMVVKVLPSVTGMVVRVRNIPLVATYDTSGTSISILPEECEYLVVLDLAQRVGLNKIASLASTTSRAKPTVPILSSVSYVNASGSTVTPVSVGVIPSVPVYDAITVPGTFLSASSSFDTAMVNEDVELAQAQIAKLAQGVQEYQSKIQENVSKLNRDLEKFKSDVQKVLDQSKIAKQEAEMNAKLATDVAMQNAIQTAQVALANNTVLIQRYQAEVVSYIQLFQIEDIERNRLLVLINTFRQEYYDTLYTKFGVKIMGNGKEK